MVENAFEITLITLILFFTSIIIVTLFRDITNVNNYDEFTLNYIGNNIYLCVNLAYLYNLSSIYCNPSSNYNFFVSSTGKNLYVQYSNIEKIYNLYQGYSYSPLYGESEDSFYIIYNNKTSIVDRGYYIES
ncbi:hypothetical protein MJ1_0240 [Nanobdella aerobiophila]|uniref:Uncharacterized protein n=1 Tax=Nanobdella aerobiophila TaxID=2586965 RepID=A0A915SSH6_9ARCH|nr:hypothetical protein [Nanobdella aerobiophila]BBL45411.1 hypothetical protein MJ1_0240 [Nanobdella aerobiophila]